jgi:hypothetical protein
VPAARFDETSAECMVSTFKEGLLSAVAHDLRIRVQRFSIEIDVAAGKSNDGSVDEIVAATAIRATFDPSSLLVVGAVSNGTLRDDVLGDDDRRKIQRSILDDVLHARVHTGILFESTSVQGHGDRHRVGGELRLHGVTRSIAFEVCRVGDHLVAEATLHQPAFGIRPFTAMLGTLRIKPDVRVRCAVPMSRAAVASNPGARASLPGA